MDAPKNEKRLSDSDLEKMAEAEFRAASTRMSAEQLKRLERYKVAAVIFFVTVVLLGTWLLLKAFVELSKMRPH